MDMCVTRRVRDDGMGDEGFHLPWVALVSINLIGIGTGSPAALENLSNVFASLAHIAIFQRLYPWYEAGILDHESHEFCRVAANVKELQSIFLNELLERSMCGEADTVTVFVREFFAEGDEWLDVPSRANDLYDDIEGRWGSSRLAVET